MGLSYTLDTVNGEVEGEFVLLTSPCESLHMDLHQLLFVPKNYMPLVEKLRDCEATYFKFWARKPDVAALAREQAAKLMSTLLHVSTSIGYEEIHTEFFEGLMDQPVIS